MYNEMKWNKIDFKVQKTKNLMGLKVQWLVCGIEVVMKTPWCVTNVRSVHAHTHFFLTFLMLIKLMGKVNASFLKALSLSLSRMVCGCCLVTFLNRTPHLLGLWLGEDQRTTTIKSHFYSSDQWPWPYLSENSHWLRNEWWTTSFYRRSSKFEVTMGAMLDNGWEIDMEVIGILHVCVHKWIMLGEHVNFVVREPKQVVSSRVAYYMALCFDIF